ncbi:MAG: hypothetical protein ACO3NK_10440 [Prochlorotrichaceae cyanobacterium]
MIIATSIALMFTGGSSRPLWQLSARNSPQGVILDVYKSNATQPTYTTVLKGQTINTEVERVSRTELPEKLGKTTFYDETLRPGRWTVVLNKTEIDIMERALIVDRSTEISPQD